MILEDLHVHTSYCDGKDKPEEIVKAAIEKGMKRIGFSGHSYAPYCEDYCMSEADTLKYIAEIKSLKEKYKNKIDILCGIEMDYYSQIDTKTFDYIIGSVHYLKVGEKYLPVDENVQMTQDHIKRYFDNDAYSFAQQYFLTVSDVVKKTGADIIGHFDLILKFNEQVKIFDENNERFEKAYKEAIDRLVRYNKPFEINTGAISRGYRTQAYPSDKILRYIYQKGGKVILASDSHSKETLLYKFDEYEKKAKEIGLSLFNDGTNPY